MINPVKYHEAVKNEQHVFLCAISGRSSSTAFQRIINSSNKVWMWGEPHGMLRQLFFLITGMKSLSQNAGIKSALNNMYNSYLENKHLSFYANAVGNLDNTATLLETCISSFLKPWAPKVKRFGFKEIDFVPIEMLEHLKEIYPQSIFIFCFRDPVLQWPSLSKLTLLVSKDFNYFLHQYNKLALTYMEFAKTHGITAFIENNDLRDINKVNKIINYLNIPEIDTSLIDVTVHTIKGKKKLSKAKTEKIMNSDAYKCYIDMKKLSSSFYEK